MNNKVSIIIPCYNQGRFLPETLDSVLNQTYENWECFILNDGSTDETDLIGKAWEDKDSRFKYIQKENTGRSNTRNLGLELANGNWIQFLDSDDILETTKLEKSLMYSQSHKIIITNFHLFDDKGIAPAYCNLKKQKFNFKSILFNWDKKYSIPIHCALISSSIAKNVKFEEDLSVNEDWIFWIDLFRKNPKTKFINESLAHYRMHTNNTTKNRVLMLEDSLKARKKIYTKLNDEEKEKFFNRIAEEYFEIKKEYEELMDSDDVYEDLQRYRRYKEKYYNIWYKKLFYAFKKRKG